MNEEKPQSVRYPLLESLLAQMNLPLRGTYTNRYVAEIFEVSVRTIQDWVRRGQLASRNLPYFPDTAATCSFLRSIAQFICVLSLNFAYFLLERTHI